ncbi:MAG: EamA family transporter [Lachnospiraceae bacterium]|nr:EamA family transporter [Lachnospiraceae bacterium]
MQSKTETGQQRIHIGSVLCLSLAALCFGTGGLFIKMIPWSPLAINGARNLIGAALIGSYLLIRRHRLVFSRQVFIGAISLMGVTVLYVIANKLTTAANTIVLQFTAPVFVILLMALIYHVKPKRADVITCILVFAGVVLFFIDGLRAGTVPGNLAALVSGIFYAGVFMMNAGKNADALSSCFLGQLASGLIFTPFCFRETDFSLYPTLTFVLLLGIVQLGGAYILFSEGIKNTPPVTAALITGLEPITNPILVALFYHEKVSVLAIIGSVIVVGSILVYNIRLAKKGAS